MTRVWVAGVDEAGRGSVLGPLAVAVAVVDKEREDALWEMGVKDSKLLSTKKRFSLEKGIRRVCGHAAVALVEPAELNRLMARHSLNEIEAMKMAAVLSRVRQPLASVFVDAPDPVAEAFSKRIKKYADLYAPIRCEHKADARHAVVAAASILAKTARDRAMEALSARFGAVGSGYAHDPVTRKFLHDWVAREKRLPPFARTAWQTSRKAMDQVNQRTLAAYREGGP